MSIKTVFILILTVLSLGAKERYISLSPSITEILYALDKGEETVGTTNYSLYPKEAQTLPVIGGYNSPNLEKIISLMPTLVIGQNADINTLKKLQKFNINTLALDLQSIKSIKSSIKLLGEKTDSKHGAGLIKNIDSAIKNAPKSKKPHSVMIVYGLNEDLRNGIYIAGHDIFFEEIIKIAGNTNAYTAKSTAQPVLNYENVIALNPDQIIILHSKATAPNVDIKKALQNWYDLPTNASKNRHISIVDEGYISIPSHRIALTIERLTREMKID